MVSKTDIANRPLVMRQIKGHERAKAGLHVGDEEIHPIEARDSVVKPAYATPSWRRDNARPHDANAMCYGIF